MSWRPTAPRSRSTVWTSAASASTRTSRPPGRAPPATRTSRATTAAALPRWAPARCRRSPRRCRRSTTSPTPAPAPLRGRAWICPITRIDWAIALQTKAAALDLAGSTGITNQENQLSGQLLAEDLQPVTRQQINDVLGNLQSEPALQQLDTKVDDAEDDPDVQHPCDANNNAVFCGGQNTGTVCTDNELAFDRWHVGMNGWRNAAGAYIAAAWRVGSGMRAQLSDPVAWRLAGVMLEYRMTLEMQGIVQDVWSKSNALPLYSDIQHPCQWGPRPNRRPLPPRSPVPTGRYAPRTRWPRGSRWRSRASSVRGAEGAGWSIKQSCASTDFEADINPIPFLSGFVKANYNTDGSGVTYFAGSKASVAGGGQRSSFESSFYVTYYALGKITDFGWDVGPDAEAGAGPVKIQTYSDHVRISFMSLFTDTPAT